MRIAAKFGWAKVFDLRQRSATGGQRLGFTLAELLVVVAVIALLAALLLPTLSRAKSAGISVACRNNLHQIGLAMEMYLGDNHRYPISWGTDAGPDWEAQFQTLQGPGQVIRSSWGLLPYLSPSGRDRRVFFCPVQEECPVHFWPGIWPDDRLSGYACNAYGTAAQFPALRLGLAVWWLPLEVVREGAVRSPADMIAYGDAFTGAWSLSPNGTNRWSWTFPGLASVPSSRHRGQGNLLFCDGHVESGKPAQWIEATDRARRRWNRDHEPHPETWQ